MKEFKEYDLIEASIDLDENVPKGSMGTILIVYDSKPKNYEVEFVDAEDNSLGVLTVSPTDIKFPQE